MIRQDEGLEMLAQSAQRLGQMSTTITEELDYQNNMLDDMEEGLDTATDNLDMVTHKTKEMITKAGGKQNFLIILVLTGVAIVLFLLIIYFMIIRKKHYNTYRQETDFPLVCYLFHRKREQFH